MHPKWGLVRLFLRWNLRALPCICKIVGRRFVLPIMLPSPVMHHPALPSRQRRLLWLLIAALAIPILLATPLLLAAKLPF